MRTKKAIIIGAGPAGLTAAYELLDKTDIKPILLEASGHIGGLAKTIDYKGNKIDVGGHRFYSKSDRVVTWWLKFLPLQNGKKIENPEKQMLIRNRLSRIYFDRKFFEYPLSLSWNTFSSLGLMRTFKILFSYLKIKIFPIQKIDSLEKFFLNRFGDELYQSFFKDYTEKVWGLPCSEINPKWGAQRVNGLSIRKTLIHALKRLFLGKNGVSAKKSETSLIEKFMYPKLGPGQLWEEVARKVREGGGEIYQNKKVVGMSLNGKEVSKVKIQDTKTKKVETLKGDYYFSTMPVKDLIVSMGREVPEEISWISHGLCYRSHITVGLLVKNFKIKDNTNKVSDNWIYIQEKDFKVARIQIFNNWSPFLVKDPNTIWLGLEYFCSEGDAFWCQSDLSITQLATQELMQLDMILRKDILDSTVIREKKAYPSYFGTYGEFEEIRRFTDSLENLFLIGRGGMHRYNNQDHSMLTAMEAVENISSGRKDKSNIWNVNTSEEYLERKK